MSTAGRRTECQSRKCFSPRNLSDGCHALYNFYFVCQHQIKNKSREKAGPSRAVTLKLSPISTLFREVNIESRKTMSNDDISLLLQELIVRWHRASNNIKDKFLLKSKQHEFSTQLHSCKLHWKESKRFILNIIFVSLSFKSQANI